MLRSASAALLVATALAAGVCPAHAVSLSGPEVLKLDWNVRALQAADLDADGRQDLLLINNDRATVEILHQLEPGAPLVAKRSTGGGRWEPVLEDARFRRESVTTGATMFDLVTGDFDGDGRLDLAYTGEPRSLTLQLSQADGTWRERVINDAPAPLNFVSGLRAARLSGAGAGGGSDLVLLGQKELAIFRHEAGGLAVPERHPLAEDNCYGLEVVDVDGDGRLDLLYLASGARDTVRVRRQTAAGLYGPEEVFPIKATRSTLQHWTPAGASGPLFACAQNPTGQIEVFRFAAPDAAAVAENPLPSPRVFAPRLTSRLPAPAALADVDGDGRSDVITADPDAAQLIVHLREPDGTFSAGRRFPSLAEIKAVAAADWDGDGRAEVFVASGKEQVAGWAEFGAAGRLGYPQPLGTAARAAGIATGDVDGDGRAEVAVLTFEKGKATVDVWSRAAAAPGGAPAAPAVLTTHTFATTAEPRALRLADANQDGRLDLLVFGGVNEPLRLFVRDAAGAWREASANAGFRKGLVEGVDAGGMALFDVDGDAKAELVFSTGTSFARALRLDAADQLQVVEQFNAREGTAQIQAVFPLGGTGDLVLYDRRSESLQWLQRGADGVHAFKQALKVGKIDLVGMEALATEVFFFGKDRFWWLPFARTSLEPRTVSSHTTDLPDVSYSDVIAGDLTGDGAPELVCIDPENNLIEVLAASATAGWESKLHFKIFEVDQHFQGRRGGGPEPRETIVADVTGDGRKDLILLVHDRVLIYPQAPE